MKYVIFSLMLGLIMLSGCSDTELSVAEQCVEFGGTFIEAANECEFISGEDCAALQGTFNECGSACRNDPEASICTMQCVPVCQEIANQ